METKNYATEINEANVGRLIQYHDNGWRIGTLDGFTEDSVRVKKITGGHVKFVKRDDVRLVIQEAEKPKATESGKPENTTPAKMPVAARKERAKTAAKSAKPVGAKKIRVRHKERQKPTPKTYDVHFNVDRIVKLYDKGRGKNVSEIAQLIGYPKNRGNNRVAAALIKAGVYKGTRTEQ